MFGSTTFLNIYFIKSIFKNQVEKSNPFVRLRHNTANKIVSECYFNNFKGCKALLYFVLT